ncbi:hypothetical protein ACR42D_04845 [Desulfovibrio caledoniensis]
MTNFSTEMFTFIETLTTEGEWSGDAVNRDPDTPFLAPQEVQDLIHFGRMAGDAAEKLLEGDLSPLGEGCSNCAEISGLAALAATRPCLWDPLEELLDKAIAPIIASLDTPELAAKWMHDEFNHQEFIGGIAYGATRQIAQKTPLEMTTKAVLLALRQSDNMADQASLLLPFMDKRCANFMAENEAHLRQHAIEIAIGIIENSSAVGAWATNAVEALQNVDIDSEYDLTEGNMLIANEVQTLWEEVTPRNIAFFAAWLCAIYRYTEFDYEIEMAFVDVEDLWELEGHQEDVDDESPDGLAA